MSKSTPKTTPQMNINIPTGQDDYVDKRTGTTWKYFATLKSEEELGPFLKKHWLYRNRVHPNTIICRCSRNKLQTNGKCNCEFRAVFLKANCTVYTKGEHNHPIFDKGFFNSGKVYVDVTGHKWNFLIKIRDDQHLKEVCQQQFMRKEGAYTYHCKSVKKTKCPFRAIHVEGAMFTREQHNHEVVNGIEGKSVTFMVIAGIMWRLIARDVNDEKKLDDIRRQQMLERQIVHQDQQGPVYHMFYCQRADKLKCKFRGRFFPDFGNFYVTNKHNHAIQINEGPISKTPKGVKRKRIESSSSEEDEEESNSEEEQEEDFEDDGNSDDSEMDDESEEFHEDSDKEEFEEESNLEVEEEFEADYEDEDSDSERDEEDQEVQNEYVLDEKLQEISSEEEEDMDFGVDRDFGEYCEDSENEDSDSEMDEESEKEPFLDEKESEEDEHVLDDKLQEIEENILAIEQQYGVNQNQNLDGNARKNGAGNADKSNTQSINVEIAEVAMEEEHQEALDVGKENAIMEEEATENRDNQNEIVAMHDLEENNGFNQNQAELDVHFVEEVNRQEYKMLPPMKRECNANNAGPKQWPTVTIDSEVAGWQWQQTRGQKEALLRPVKKEEPAEQGEQPAELSPPNQPTTSNANKANLPANPNLAQHKMYLRARKPVNYAEN